MIIEIIVVTILGILAGIISGLTPGIHINLISILLFTASPFLFLYTSPLILVIFIVAMSVTHTFFNAIPAIYLGAPESAENILSVLPGHRMLLEGRAYEALALTVIGSILALIVGVLISPLIIFILPKIYLIIQDYIGYILLLAVIFLIYRDQKKVWALIIFLIAGVFGLSALNLNIPNPLFPLLSSLFGTAGILISLKDKVKIPKQKVTFPKSISKQTTKALISST
ncbi:MAG: tripartite tricarboxylate transporter permease, partial [Nanoarchaeota archaeon]|nr:tripartite tricarboxylate transporter permease [Nanoarchaeota archaeon]